MATAGDRRGAGPERAWAASWPAAGEVVLGADESRHLVRVRRVALGDEVVLFDGLGGTVYGRLDGDDPRGARVRVLGPAADREPPTALTLAVALPEGGRADDLVATLAEIGVTTLVPLHAERMPPGRRDLARRRAARWGRLVREAAKVNGRSRFLVVEAPVDLPAALARAPAAVLLDPDPSAPWLLDLLEGASEPPWLLVGPEGGFTDAEIAAARAAGVPRGRVAVPALRTGTAAVVAAAQVLARPF